MKPTELRSLNIDLATHKQIKKAAAERECQMKDLVREAWAAYQPIAHSSILNEFSLVAPVPSPDLIPSLHAVASKLGAAKAELLGIIAQTERGNDASDDFAIAHEAREATAAASRLERAPRRSARRNRPPKAS